MLNAKYALGSLISLPLLPIMYLHGRRMKLSMPDLPEASGMEGMVRGNSTRTLRLLAVGESSIAGVGVRTHEEGFTGTLAKSLADKLKTSVNWKVYAKSGYTAKQVRKLLLPSISERSADMIVIGVGANDAFTLNSPWKWRSHVQCLIEDIRRVFEHIPIVFINMPPVKEFPAATRIIKFTVGNLIEILGEELMRLIEKQTNVYYYSRKMSLADWEKRLNVTGPPSEFFSDGIHPSRLTYQVWARDVANYLIGHQEIAASLQDRLNLPDPPFACEPG